MLDTMAGDPRLVRRLEAYAEARLSPDRAATARIRARVLATAHRRADLLRSETGLLVLPSPTAVGVASSPTPARAIRRRPSWRRRAPVLLAAALALATVGTALAARPGRPFYEARMWVEAMTLPGEPSARAVAELGRLEERLREALEAHSAGDVIAIQAALDAYARIVDETATEALLAGDPVAAAALETGMGHNLDVLRTLSERVPDTAGAAIDAAIARAIARSGDAIDAIDRDGHPGAGGANGGAPGGAPGAAPPSDPAMTSKPAKGPSPEPTAKPTKTPIAEPAGAATPSPERTPPGKPGGEPGSGDQGGDGG